jgi:hypothetical protein
MDEKRLEDIKIIKDNTKAKNKGKDFKNLSTKEKDEILEALAKMFGLIQ